MYTLIIMSSQKNSVRQHVIGRGLLLLLSCVILGLFCAAIGGFIYGLFQKRQRVSTENELQTRMTKEIQQLTQAKHQVESELAAVNKEMNEIRQMAEKIREALGILGQGGELNTTSSAGESEPQQTDISAFTDAAPDTHEPQKLTPSILKEELQALYNYINAYQKQLFGYPLILPVKFQQENGEQHAFWYSSHFGWRNHPLTKNREFHQGLDIKTRAGVPVIAAADGTVVQVGEKGYLGNTIEIIHEASGYKTLYAHLQGYAEGLKVNQEVVRGQIIGYVGNTGRSTGAHLHYGIYDIEKERWRNPTLFIFNQEPTLSP
ncbi:peptidoglycan DD-metalloendopeptidase family protein [Candidatus Poribacteria bacterium]|nr:peptidoglycan DD-metalloendopeptidase family protein [Candidatus Poribacteria bacterium]